MKTAPRAPAPASGHFARFQNASHPVAPHDSIGHTVMISTKMIPTGCASRSKADVENVVPPCKRYDAYVVTPFTTLVAVNGIGIFAGESVKAATSSADRSMNMFVK